MNQKTFLGEFEQMVLLAILQLGDTSYGPGIGQELERRAGRSVSRGALYSALGRLEKKGYLEWTSEAPTPERGGHPRRLFRVVEPGLEALRASRAALLNLWAGLDEVLG